MSESLTHVVHDNRLILEAGRYTAPSGAVVELGEAVAAAQEGTRGYRPREAAELVAGAGPAAGAAPRVEVTPEATGAAGQRLVEKEGAADVVALNFASARNAGGGYLNGARAQEEQLCRTSGLYPCMLRVPDYYSANRSSRSLLYSDHALYSPRVPFFRNEQLELQERPFQLSVITSPAPNAGALRREQPDLEDRVEPTLRARAGQVLAIAQAHGHRTLLLGAWGCGAFANDPTMVADAFGLWLEGERFRGAFERVIFAIYTPRPRDARNLEAFQARFASPAP